MSNAPTTPDAEPAKPERKPLVFVGPSLADLTGFPQPVKRSMGHSLHVAQMGGKASNAKVMQGFGGAGVLEVVEDHDGSTFRAIYTVKLQGVVYVLAAFQKKSTKGISTPKHLVDLIKSRYADAVEIHKLQGSTDE